MIKIKFLRDCVIPVSNMWYCGDECRCCHLEWNQTRCLKDEVFNAVFDEMESEFQEDVALIHGLIFGRDYIIVEKSE